MSKLFFDTESNGLPNMKIPPGDAAGQPNIVQLAAMLTDNEGALMAEISFLVKPEGWTISKELSAIHGITTEMCEMYGLSIKGILSIFSRMALNASSLVAHNIRFDLFMLEIEAARTGVFIELPKQYYCTMKSATNVVKIPPTPKMASCGMTCFKNPNLAETYRHFFGVDFEDAHNALADVRACKEIYFALQKDDIAA